MDSGVVGELALRGAIGAAGMCLAAHVPTRRPNRHRPGWWEHAAAGVGLLSAGLAGLAVGALAWSLLTGNFALTYVADTTTRQGGWPYRLAGLWGGNAGSLLLWATLVLAVGTVATRHHARARLVVVATGGALLFVDVVAADPFARLAIPAIDGGGLTPILQYPAMLYHPLLVYAGHAALVVPFAVVLAGLASGRLAADGGATGGLLPDGGATGGLVPDGGATGGLAPEGGATGRPEAAWLEASRRWMLIAWLLLGVALIAGAHWAYVEVGWGGFWGWDPVENSGLLPWLAATAFLHHARSHRHPGQGARAASLAGLAALPFALSLVGAALSRSGAAQSVHGFAEATAVGRGLLAVLTGTAAAVVLAGAAGSRRRHLDGAPATGDRPGWATRPGWGTAAGAVATPAGAVATPAGAVATPAGAVATPAGAVATPAGAVATPAGAVATPAGAVATPAGAVATPAGAVATPAGAVATPGALATAVILLLALTVVILAATVFPVVARVVAGQTIEVATRYYAVVALPVAVLALIAMGIGPTVGRRHRRPVYVVAATVAAVTGLLLARGARPPAVAPALLGAAAAWAVVLAAVEIKNHHGLRRAGALLAHAGVAILLFGTAGSLLGHHVTEVVRPGASLSVDGYTLRYRQALADQGPAWQRVRVVLDVSEHGREVAVLTPALRVFPNQTAALSDVALRSTPARDLLVTVGLIDPLTGAATISATTRPLIELVWWGGLLAAAGGAIVLLSTRTHPRPRTGRRPRRRRPPTGIPRSDEPTPGCVRLEDDAIVSSVLTTRHREKGTLAPCRPVRLHSRSCPPTRTPM